MKIAVCIKQVPNTTEIKIDPATGTMIREGIATIINPDDKHAIEEAIRIKDEIENKKEKDIVETVVLTMGPPQAEEALHEALAMGIDKAILISDRHFAGSDTAATSYILSKAIEKLGNVDLILCGRQAIDGDTAQTGPQMAELLGLGQVTYVRKIEFKNQSATSATKKDAVSGVIIRVERQMENGYEIIESSLPVLLTVVKEINTPRYPTLYGIHNSVNTEIIKWTNEDLKAKHELIGLKGSPTKVKKSFSPPAKGQCQFIQGNSTKEIAQKLVSMFKEKEILQEF